MKLITLLVFLINFQMISSQNLEEFRILTKSGEDSEVATNILIEKSSAAYKKTKDPIFQGFLGIGTMMMAKHTFSPFRKISYFNEGKKTLEKAIKSEPKNLELRLLRLITQEKIPAILNYNSKIKEDKSFLMEEYHTTSDQNLKLIIKDYLKI